MNSSTKNYHVYAFKTTKKYALKDFLKIFLKKIKNPNSALSA